MDWLQEALGDELTAQVNGAIEAYNAKPENEGKQIKIGNLGTGAYVSRSKYDDDLSRLQTELKDAGENAQKYSDLKGKYDILQKKYDDQKYEYAVKSALSDLKFSSNAAKKAFTDELMKNRLAFENDTLAGLDDYIGAYKASDPGAFVSEQAEDNKPAFMAPTGSTPPATETKFGFDFTGVREKPKT